MKAAVFDIEVTDFAAIGAGKFLCCSIKPLMEDVITFRYDKHGGEKNTVKAVVDKLCEFDMLIGHNIVKFDWPYLMSKACLMDVIVPTRPFYYDTLQGFRRTGYKTVPNMFGKPSAGLDHIIDFFGFEQEKTKIYPREHWQTIWATGEDRTKAMDKLVEHCEADVNMTEKIYWKLMRADSSTSIRRLR